MDDSFFKSVNSEYTNNYALLNGGVFYGLDPLRGFEEDQSTLHQGCLVRRLFTLPHDQSCLRWMSSTKLGTDNKLLLAHVEDGL